MAIPRSDLVLSSADFAVALLARPGVRARAHVVARRVTDQLPASAAVVHVKETPDAAFIAVAMSGDVKVAAQLQFSTMSRVTILEGQALRRETYAHLDVRRTVESLTYVPLMFEEGMIGIIEIISFDRALDKAELAPMEELGQIASTAIAAAISYEQEQNNLLQSVSRVTQMYDLEKVFNSTLEIHPLLQLIANKFQEVMRVQAVNVWMVDGDAVRLVNRSGDDPTSDLDSIQVPGDGIAGDLSDNGEPVLIPDPQDGRLSRRNKGQSGTPIFSLLGCALMDRDSLVGVVEVINREDGAPFDDDDLFLLTSICQTANNALHNASLLQSERKLEVLETLVKVSHEITSTLDVDRVLQAVIKGARSVVAYDRAAMALEQRGNLVLKVVSGMTAINFSDPTVKLLKEMLEWASLSKEEIHVRQRGSEIDVEREASRAKFREYFEITGARTFFVLPLDDDQGRLGLLSLESRDPEFLSQAHMEVIRVLAAQTTVALRNASLYREVPFIDVLQPVLEKKRKFLAMEKRRRALLLGAAAAVTLFLVAFPVPMRLSGSAVVAPVHRAQVMAAADGVVKTVYVREGDNVPAGAVLADLEDWNARSAVAAARAKYESALADVNRALVKNDGSEAGVQRVQADYWMAELKRLEEQLDKTHLRAPIAGVVGTRDVENMVGRHLSPADTFAEVIDAEKSLIDVAIEERDVGLLSPRQPATVKLNSFPLETFRGQVQVVSPVGGVENDEKVFFARVLVPNPQGLIRAGMQGRGKVAAGWRPAGYVLLRRPAMWIYSKLWEWLGW
ncbi:MAG TPA: efflux RND transporter periplasmic adaptor subunit [Candidatus Sulfotelmatobacter sp.]|nr:efflux RND transporter periplasmic adaptor subunit [Candidatus Sulfotelmatobacter sp.]